MCHHDDGDYLCQIRDSQAGGTVGAGGGTTVAPGIMALAPPGVPSPSPTPFKSASTTALVPADAGLYVLGGGAQAQVPTSESALARMFKGLAADADTDETEVVRLLQSLLATSETTKPPKLNPVEKVLGTDVRTLAARASIAYPVLSLAATRIEPQWGGGVPCHHVLGCGHLAPVAGGFVGTPRRRVLSSTSEWPLVPLHCTAVPHCAWRHCTLAPSLN